MNKLWRRLRALARRDRLERELEEEMRFHLEMKMAEGRTRSDAQRAFGNTTLHHDRSRDVWGWRWLEDLAVDLRYSARTLRRSPAFALVAITSLALGIGANTAIFTLVDAVLLRMLPVQHPEQLVFLSRSDRGGFPFAKRVSGISHELFEALAEPSEAISGAATFATGQRLSVEADGRTDVADGLRVSANYFSLLGVEAIAGRTFTAADDRLGAGSPVAVLSYGYWKRRFALDPSVVGRTIAVNGTPLVVLGVTPREFFGVSPGSAPDISIPITTPIAPYRALSERSRKEPLAFVLARMRPGITEQQAAAALTLRLHQFAGGARRSDAPPRRIELSSASRGLETLRAQFSEPLRLLMAVVALVLVIACANLASLLLVRASARRREFAVRLALGAGRARLVRQLLTESVLLGVLGGCLGLLLAYWGNGFVADLLSSARGPIVLDLTPDRRVLAFNLAVSLLTGVLFGLAPALGSGRVDLQPALQSEATCVTAPAPRLVLGKLLVVGQVALSLVLLVGAGLFVRTLIRLETMDMGFQRRNVATLELVPELALYPAPRIAAVYAALLERIEAVPGVRSATLSRNSLLSGGITKTTVSVPGFVPATDDDRWVSHDFVGPRFFETAGIEIVRGRDFARSDNELAPKVAAVNETLARFYFGGDDPMGKKIEDLEIVAVVRDGKYAGLKEAATRMLYVPFLQNDRSRNTNLVVRTTGDPARMIPTLRSVVAAVDPTLPVLRATTLAEQVDATLVQERLVAALASAFGALALALACVGLYGVMAYGVARRTREIGIRMALGARSRDVHWLIQRDTLLLVLAGAAIGIPAALAASRLVAAQLYGIAPGDPASTILASVLLILVALGAGLAPTRRAARVDPMEALRHE